MPEAVEATLSTAGVTISVSGFTLFVVFLSLLAFQASPHGGGLCARGVWLCAFWLFVWRASIVLTCPSSFVSQNNIMFSIGLGCSFSLALPIMLNLSLLPALLLQAPLHPSPHAPLHPSPPLASSRLV